MSGATLCLPGEIVHSFLLPLFLCPILCFVCLPGMTGSLCGIKAAMASPAAQALLVHVPGQPREGRRSLSQEESDLYKKSHYKRLRFHAVLLLSIWDLVCLVGLL